MTQYVICALQMEGFHCWPEADGELAYLKNSHRHIFFITAEFPVRNANREIEIISQQNAIKRYLLSKYIAKHGSTKGGRWLWNNGSTITSQIWDTVIYAVISFGFGLGWVHTHEGRMQLIGIIIGQYLLKACLALLDTPFFYFFTRNADRR